MFIYPISNYLYPTFQLRFQSILILFDSILAKPSDSEIRDCFAEGEKCFYRLE